MRRYQEERGCEKQDERLLHGSFTTFPGASTTEVKPTFPKIRMAANGLRFAPDGLRKPIIVL